LRNKGDANIKGFTVVVSWTEEVYRVNATHVPYCTVLWFKSSFNAENCTANAL